MGRAASTPTPTATASSGNGGRRLMGARRRDRCTAGTIVTAGRGGGVSIERADLLEQCHGPLEVGQPAEVDER